MWGQCWLPPEPQRDKNLIKNPDRPVIDLVRSDPDPFVDRSLVEISSSITLLLSERSEDATLPRPESQAPLVVYDAGKRD